MLGNTPNKNKFRFQSLRILPNSRWSGIHWAIAFVAGLFVLLIIFLYFREARSFGNPFLRDGGVSPQSALQKLQQKGQKNSPEKSFNSGRLIGSQSNPLRYRTDLATLPAATLNQLNQQIIDHLELDGWQNKEALLDLSLIYLHQNQLVDAREIIFQMIADDPYHRFTQYLLGLLEKKTKQSDRAIDIWQDALAQKNSVSTLKRGKQEERLIRLGLGELYHLQGRYYHALAEFKKVRKINRQLGATDEVYLFILAANTYQALQDTASSVTLYRLVLRSPTASLPQKQIAGKMIISDLLARNQLGAARQLTQTIKAWDPLDPQIILLESRLRLLSDSSQLREQVIEELNVLVSSTGRTKETLSQAYNLLGVAYQKNGENQLAREAFAYALEFNPSNKEAYQNKISLDSIY